MAVSEEKRRKGKAARDKGSRGERLLRDELRALGFTEVTRGFVWNHTSDLVGLKGIHVEAKRIGASSVLEEASSPGNIICPRQAILAILS